MRTAIHHQFFRHQADATLCPAVKDWTRLLTDPDRDELARMIRVGQGVTWPKVRFRCCRSRQTPQRETDRGFDLIPYDIAQIKMIENRLK